MRQVREYPFHGNPGSFHHRFADHDLRVSDDTLEVGWLFFLVHAVHLPMACLGVLSHARTRCITIRLR